MKADLSWEIPATCVALFVRSTSKLEEERCTVKKRIWWKGVDRFWDVGEGERWIICGKGLCFEHWYLQRLGRVHFLLLFQIAMLFLSAFIFFYLGYVI